MDPDSRPASSREDILEYAAQFPYFNLIGLEVLDVRPGWSRTRIAWRPDLTQPAGVMHGGVIASLVDTGIAHAILMLGSARDVLDQGGAIVSIDLRVKYFRPVASGMLTCESTVTRGGRRIIHAESVVVNEEGKEVARGDATYMAVPADQLRRP